MESNGRKLSNEFLLSIAIFIITVVFAAGSAVMSFESKTESDRKQEVLKEYVEKMYMPRELSLEKWSTNEKSHREIKETLDAILKELRRNDSQRFSKSIK